MKRLFVSLLLLTGPFQEWNQHFYLTLCDDSNGRGELPGGDVFEYIAQGSRLQTGLVQLLIVEGCQDDNADLRPVRDDGMRRTNAIQTRREY